VCLYLLLRQEREGEVSSLASSRQTVLEVRVPLDSVSYVIGRQGANIKEVQAKTDTRINFRDEVAGEQYRVCLVRGSPADCQMAEILIQQMLARQARPEVVELVVPTRAVGRIIGRAGETVRSIQRLSGAKVDVERADSGEERRVTLRGTREDIETAQKMIEEKVKEEELTRLSVTSRPPRIKYKQPLFLNYDQNSDEETMAGAGEREAEQLEPSASDNCMEVLVSAISSPGSFWVQKVGPRSVELDRLTAEMTDWYGGNSGATVASLSPDAVQLGDIVAASFGEEESFYRAKIVSYQEDSYDASHGLVGLDFVDYGDHDEKRLTEVFSIRAEFLKLKFQAIECQLAGVKPHPGPVWSDEASNSFEELTHCALWRVVTARVVEFTGQMVPCVELVDRDINIGRELVRQGLATWKQ